MTKRWRVAEACPPDFAPSVAAPSAITGQLLWNRGLHSREEVAAFLSPDWDGGIHDHGQFRHMAGAVRRIFAALENGERITVHGDYDADGITGSTVIITTLKEIERHMVGADPCVRPIRPAGGQAHGPAPTESLIDFYIPHRDKEGYGLHRETVQKLKAISCKLIITVDCGIACVDEIALARSSNMDTIVVDHHQFGETLPDGHLIHPGLPEETYPFKKLAAVGVSYKFSCALLDEARRRNLDIQVGWEKWLLDLVAIATVTDMVPLIGENRVLETYGLRVLNKTRRAGLRALIESAGLSLGSLDTESVGFSIGPRLNAAGRTDHASLALRLLLSESEDEARGLVQELERCNRERQEATKKMMGEAEKKLTEAPGASEASARTIVLWSESWSPALVGLVAGKFADRFARPTLVIGQHDGKWIGSGRSIDGYDITQALRESSMDLLTRMGGHPQACGFALEDASRLPVLRQRFEDHASERLTEEDLIPTLNIDADIPLTAIDWPLVQSLEVMQPFGEGNRRPVFVSRHCPVVACDAVGAAKNHLRLTLLDQGGRRVKAIGFKLGDRLSSIALGGAVDIVYHVDVNEWNGRREIQCKLIDLEPAKS